MISGLGFAKTRVGAFHYKELTGIYILLSNLFLGEKHQRNAPLYNIIISEPGHTYFM
jgi:hypothetical protein